MCDPTTAKYMYNVDSHRSLTLYTSMTRGMSCHCQLSLSSVAMRMHLSRLDDQRARPRARSYRLDYVELPDYTTVLHVRRLATTTCICKTTNVLVLVDYQRKSLQRSPSFSRRFTIVRIQSCTTQASAYVRTYTPRRDKKRVKKNVKM